MACSCSGSRGCGVSLAPSPGAAISYEILLSRRSSAGTADSVLTLAEAILYNAPRAQTALDVIVAAVACLPACFCAEPRRRHLVGCRCPRLPHRRAEKDASYFDCVRAHAAMTAPSTNAY